MYFVKDLNKTKEKKDGRAEKNAQDLAITA